MLSILCIIIFYKILLSSKSHIFELLKVNLFKKKEYTLTYNKIILHYQTINDLYSHKLHLYFKITLMT